MFGVLRFLSKRAGILHQIPMLVSILFSVVDAENIVRHHCGYEATFYKISSNHALNNENAITKKTSSGVDGCVDFCMKMETCKAFNYKAKALTCELLQYDRNTKANDVIRRDGWSYYDTGLFSSQVGQRCSGLSYNPCFPCLCIDSCNAELGYTCNCTQDSPPLPSIFIAFEKSLASDVTKIEYDRGMDKNGNSVVHLLNGANIGTSDGRPGKVLRITGRNAGAIIGTFQGHALNNPADAKLSITFWIRVLSPQSNDQTVLGAGRPGDNTGILVRITNMGTAIRVRQILSNRELTSQKQVSDALMSWSFLAITCDTYSHRLNIYLNGREIDQTTQYVGMSRASLKKHPQLIFGAGALYPLINDHWNIHIDDFAVWDNNILTANEVIYVMNKGFV